MCGPYGSPGRIHFRMAEKPMISSPPPPLLGGLARLLPTGLQRSSNKEGRLSKETGDANHAGRCSCLRSEERIVPIWNQELYVSLPHRILGNFEGVVGRQIITKIGAIAESYSRRVPKNDYLTYIFEADRMLNDIENQPHFLFSSSSHINEK